MRNPRPEFFPIKRAGKFAEVARLAVPGPERAEFKGSRLAMKVLLNVLAARAMARLTTDIDE